MATPLAITDIQILANLKPLRKQFHQLITERGIDLAIDPSFFYRHGRDKRARLCCSISDSINKLNGTFPQQAVDQIFNRDHLESELQIQSDFVIDDLNITR
jgi:hypothetical protein